MATRKTLIIIWNHCDNLTTHSLIAPTQSSSCRTNFSSFYGAIPLLNSFGLLTRVQWRLLPFTSKLVKSHLFFPPKTSENASHEILFQLLFLRLPETFYNLTFCVIESEIWWLWEEQFFFSRWNRAFEFMRDWDTTIGCNSFWTMSFLLACLRHSNRRNKDWRNWSIVNRRQEKQFTKPFNKPWQWLIDNRSILFTV